MTEEDRPPMPEATTDHTIWVWYDEFNGWVEVEKPPPPPLVATPKPDDTATTTWDRSIEVINGAPTIVWTERPWTAEELAPRLAEEARAAARAEVQAILDALRVEKDRVQVVIDKANSSIGPADTKDVARAVKRVADAAISLARYVG